MTTEFPPGTPVRWPDGSTGVAVERPAGRDGRGVYVLFEGATVPAHMDPRHLTRVEDPPAVPDTEALRKALEESRDLIARYLAGRSQVARVVIAKADAALARDVPAASDAVVVPRELLDALAGSEPCREDSYGGCHTHGSLDLNPCPNAEAQELLSEPVRDVPAPTDERHPETVGSLAHREAMWFRDHARRGYSLLRGMARRARELRRAIPAVDVTDRADDECARCEHQRQSHRLVQGPRVVCNPGEVCGCRSFIETTSGEQR